jgi:hypothetical protein
MNSLSCLIARIATFLLIAAMSSQAWAVDAVKCDTANPEQPCSIDLTQDKIHFTIRQCHDDAPIEIQYEDATARNYGDPFPCTQSGEKGYACEVPVALKGRTDGHLKIASGCQKGKYFAIVGKARLPTVAAVSVPLRPRSALPVLPESVWREALVELRIPTADHGPGNYYSRSSDVAVLFFDAEGVPYYPMLDVIDEDDDIYVVVADFSDRLAQAKIAVQGCKRPPVEPRVYGRPAGVEPRGEGGREVIYVVRAFGKCAGADDGGPELVITHDNVPRSVTIPVNPLYRLAVGVAAAFDGTSQRDFSLQTLPGDTVPRISQTSERIGLTSLLYISFYPVARDYRKTNLFLAQRLQLFVGLDPRAFDEHLVLGAGYELAMGLNVLVGWRALTKQKILSEGSGLSRGTTFDGDARDIPTRKRWETGGVFLGAGLSSALLEKLL